MSRIAGFMTRNPGAERIVRAMLHFMGGPGARLKQHTESSKGSFGWIGRDSEGFAAQGTLVLCLDGIIFNCRELNGPRNASDAQVLLDMVARFGMQKALAMVNGDFAVAVADIESGSVQLARDRVGMKPLYYAIAKDGAAFASRSGALFAVDGVSTEPNRRFAAVFAGGHYRSIDNVPEESPYRDIRQVPPATIVTLGRNGSVTSTRYWDLARVALSTADDATLAEQYRALLLDAVALRSARSTRPAFTLSGGLDSSTVVCCAVEARNGKQDAFSTVYSDQTFDESADIQPMLENKVAHWHQVRVDDPPVMSLIRDMVGVHDEPVATATWLPHFILAQQVAGEGFDSLFGGLGGDELNAGEYEYFIYHFADLRAQGDARLQDEILAWQRHHDHPIYRKGPAEAAQAMARLTDSGGRVRVDQARLRRYFDAVRPDWYDLDSFEQQLDHPFPDWLRNRTYQDIFRETAPCCLRAEDRHTSAFGLQRFDPFFDWRLIEFMFSVPGTSKIRNGVTKRLLREATAGLLPEETRLRVKKTGWNAPAHLWFSEGKNLADLRDLIGSAQFRQRGLYDPAVVTRILDEHCAIVKSGKPVENHMMFLWQLANAENWLQAVPDIAHKARASN